MGTLPNSKFLKRCQHDFRNALLFFKVSKVSKDFGGSPMRRGGVRGGGGQGQGGRVAISLEPLETLENSIAFLKSC